MAHLHNFQFFKFMLSKYIDPYPAKNCEVANLVKDTGRRLTRNTLIWKGHDLDPTYLNKTLCILIEILLYKKRKCTFKTFSKKSK